MTFLRSRHTTQMYFWTATLVAGGVSSMVALVWLTGAAVLMSAWLHRAGNAKRW